MQQNFWDLDGNGIKLQDDQMHHCKLYSGKARNLRFITKIENYYFLTKLIF